jgi:hypothetical protein
MKFGKVKPGTTLYFSLKETEITPHTVFVYFIRAVGSDRVWFHFYSITKEVIRENNDYSYARNWDSLHAEAEEITPKEMTLAIKAIFEG